MQFCNFLVLHKTKKTYGMKQSIVPWQRVSWRRGFVNEWNECVPMTDAFIDWFDSITNYFKAYIQEMLLENIAATIACIIRNEKGTVKHTDRKSESGRLVFYKNYRKEEMDDICCYRITMLSKEDWWIPDRNRIEAVFRENSWSH